MKKIDWLLLTGIIIISLFGLLMIYSASYVWAEYKFDDPYKFVKTQALFLIVGYILMFIVLKIPYTKYLTKSNTIFICCVILLILVLIPGIGVVRNGSRSWFGIGPFGIQPSEIAKLSLIIFTSKYLANHHNKMNNTKQYVFPILLIIIFIFGLILLEPDFGSGAITVMSVIALIIAPILANITPLLQFLFK